MQAGFDRANWRPGYAGNIFERIIFDKVQQQHGTLRQRQLIQQLHEFGFLFLPYEPCGWIILNFGRDGRKLFERGFFAALLAPPLNAFLVRDAEEPTAELLIVAQAAEIPDGIDKGLLHNVETGLLVMDQLKSIDIQGQLIAPEQSVPRLRLSGPGLRHGQLFAFSHCQHLQPVECSGREKVQRAPVRGKLAAMPELPDITIYLEALERRVLGKILSRVRVASPFLLRTVAPPLAGINGRTVAALRRVGKRIAFGFEDELWLVLHLMIGGRLHWREAGAKHAGKHSLAALDFQHGSLLLTEAGNKKRASLHLVQGHEALRALDKGGLEVLSSSLDAFSEALTRRNHTLKRALTDPGLFGGIGNAYSDEILHAARLSPVALSQKLAAPEIARLHLATQETLRSWIWLLRQQTGDEFPENVTAFRPEMAVHGKFGQPCPVCGAKVQRIRYADNETNYCPGCQTGGKLLADRSLSLLLKKDWPKTPGELEELRNR